MKAGLITNIKTMTYTHGQTAIPFPPSETSEGKDIWKWDYIFDSVLDVNFELSEKSFIGAISIQAEKDTISKIEAVIDNKVVGAYSLYNASRDHLLDNEIIVPVTEETDHITLRIYPLTNSNSFPGFKTLSLCDIKFWGIVNPDEPLVYPYPKNLVFEDGFVKINEIISLNDDADSLFTKNFLTDEISDQINNKDGVNLLIEKNTSPEYDNERCVVYANDKEIRIIASDRLTLLSGAYLIIKILGCENAIRKFHSDDTPSQKIRGFHMGLPSRENFTFAKKLFRYMLLPLRYNMIIMEFAGGMRFSSHPEISEAWETGCENARKGLQPPFPHAKMGADGHLLEKEEVKDLVSFIKDLGFNFVPEIQSLSHVQYITYAHPEIAEVDPTEETPLYPHSYCPSNEKSYEIIFDLIDEILDLVSPREYVHIGHDEVYQMGLCEKCKGKDLSDLLAMHINRLYDYITKRGLKVMMWSDMFHPVKIAQDFTHEAINKIPKDILFLDFRWYFYHNSENEDEVLGKGFNVLVGNLYSSHYRNFKERMAKEDMVGGQVSTWFASNEDGYSLHGRLYDAIYLSHMLSNTEDFDEHNRYTYNEIIAKYIQKPMRDKLRGAKAVSSEETYFPEKTNKPIPSDLEEFSSPVAMDDAEIKIDAFAKKIVFNHATIHSRMRMAWQRGYKVGEYIINYEDGTKLELPIEYGKNILSYKTLYGAPRREHLYHHMGYIGTFATDPVVLGKNSLGETISTFDFPIENPHPEKKINSISYRRSEDEFLTLMLSSVKLLK